MRSFKNQLAVLFILASAFTACTKAPIDAIPGNPGNPGNPSNPGNEFYIVKVKAVVGIGNLIYDSVPATLKITSWDNLNVSYQQQTNLLAGANEIKLPRMHQRYKLELTKWGLSDQISFTKEEIAEGTLISLGGTKSAKRLTREESFVYASGSYQPQSKTEYIYEQGGRPKKVKFYQKKPQFQDLLLFTTDTYLYRGNLLDWIDTRDEKDNSVGFTTFAYDEHEKIIRMQQKSYDQLTNANVYYQYPAGHAEIKFYYTYSNGQGMQYVTTFKGGNMVEDAAISTTGGSEGGTYNYDFNINPYAHMNMPNLYLSNMSKNNLAGQQKGYGGNIPSGVPYKYEYMYDADGYPVEVIKSFKSYVTGEHLYTTKTIYTY